ncbi:MAG: DNA primase [Lachnospiraceae bacterium]|nr:DNA primase [Lachnospiraceae bacterium]
MYYPDEIIEEVRSRTNIVDVIGSYVKLQKKGGSYFARCPFHSEKTPSFSVSPSKQMYYCFGCHAGGSVFTFLMQYENISFNEAVSELAGRAGVALPQAELSGEERKRENLRQQLFDINREAAQYFHKNLRSDKGERSRNYLGGRALTWETCVNWGLGYAGNYNNELYRHLKDKGYSDEVLGKSGLFVVNEKSGFRDKFWNRVMFPIMDVNNKVIAFGGRIMGQGEPKYLNSNETDIFNKRRNLYGLNYAKKSRVPYLILCEGYMDVISMHQAGFTNAVASLGTAFTSEQCTLIKRYSQEVRLAYDSDLAGRSAALRAIPILRKSGIRARVINMQPCKDPDEFIKQFGKDEFQSRIDNAQNGFMFELDQLCTRYDMSDPEGKSAFEIAAAKKMLELSEPLERENYMTAFCERYGIDISNFRRTVNHYGAALGTVDYAAVQGAVSEDAGEAQEFRGYLPESREKGAGRNSSNAASDAAVAERLLLGYIAENPGIMEKLDSIISPDDFTDPVCRKTAEIVIPEARAGRKPLAVRLVNSFEDLEEQKEAAEIFNSTFVADPTQKNIETALNDVVRRVKQNKISSSKDMPLDEMIRRKKELQSLRISLD